jgi:peptide/nickel transport system permease protein
LLAICTHAKEKLSLETQIGISVLFVLILCAVFAPLIAPASSELSPFRLNLAIANAPPKLAQHFLGTDNLGRDVFGLLVWGARASLTVGFVSAAAALIIGSVWGATGALAGGWIEAVMMRTVDVLLSIPSLILLLIADAFVADLPYQKLAPPWLLSLLGITNYSNGLLPLLTVIIVISATTWLECARLARAQVKTVLSEEYIAAAAVCGLDFWQIIVRHLLPNASNVILVEGLLLIADAILAEAGLSFLGLGLGPSTPSWGSMLAGAQQCLLQGNWWSVLAPGALITVSILAISIAGRQAISQRRTN